MGELYERVESFVRSLKTDPVEPTRLQDQGQQLFQKLGPLIEAVPDHLSMLQAQNFTLEAFALGMVCGAGDGMLDFFHHAQRKSEVLALSDKRLENDAKILTHNLGQIRTTAKENWSKAHPDDLHLLCGYGKQENLGSLQEGAKLAEECDDDLYPYRKFLLATFKGGYAIGMIQAAVVVLAEEI